MESDNVIVVPQLSDNVAEGSVELIDQGKISDTDRVSGDKNKHRSTIDCDNVKMKNTKSPKLAVENGSWSCTCHKCVAKDDENMLSCTKCKSKYHFKCTELPVYQISMFLSPGYRKFVCADCVHVSAELQEKWDSTRQSEPNVVDTMLDKVQKELSISKEVIKSIEMTCETLHKLARDKDEIIAQQKIIINSCKSDEQNEELANLRTKLDDANRNIEESNLKLRETQSLLHIQINETNTADSEKLKKELEIVQRIKEDLCNELTNQVLLTKRTELAFNTQSKLVNTKDELIKNQQVVIEILNKAQEDKQDNSEHSNESTATPAAVPGLQESILCLSNIALHGVVMNGFLVWADIQRRTTAENI